MSVFSYLRRLTSRKEDESVSSFIKNDLHIRFKSIEPYKQALTHRSVSGASNERLEYLGDALLGLVVAQELYRIFPDQEEGFLTRVRAKAVCRENLNKVAHEIELDKRLQTAMPMKRNSENVYGNAFEALVGAIFLDAGYEEAADFVRRKLIGRGGQNLKRLSEKEVDFKSRLLEYAQAEHIEVKFNMLGEKYELHDDRHVFLYEVVLADKVVAQAAGYSKREAQQAVAKKALHIVQNKQ